MAFTQIPDENLFKVVETGETVEMGQFQPTKNGQLDAIVLFLHKQGTIGGSETATISIYNSSDLTRPYKTSDAVSISTIEGASYLNETGGWMAKVRFDFNRVPINKNISYYLTYQMSNYTRNGFTYYFSLVLDWPHDQIYPGTPKTWNKPRYEVISFEEV